MGFKLKKYAEVRYPNNSQENSTRNKIKLAKFKERITAEGHGKLKHEMHSEVLRTQGLQLIDDILLFFYTPLPPHLSSNKHQICGATRGFKNLSTKTYYICHGLINLHANFSTNWTI